MKICLNINLVIIDLYEDLFNINLVINKLVNLYWTKREILRVGQKKDLFRKASLFRKSWEDFVDLSIVIQGRTGGGGLLIT